MALWTIGAALILALNFPSAHAGVTDGVDGWTHIGPPPVLASAVAIDPSQPSTLYVATLHGVFKSRDGGSHWSPSSAGLPGSSNGTPLEVFSLSVNPVSPEIVLAGTEQGVFRSQDSGITWTRSSGFQFPYEPATSIRQNRLQPSVVYTITYAGCYRSSDSGMTWSRLPNSLGAGAFVIDPDDSQRLFVGGGLGFFSSSDGGQHWSMLTSPPGEAVYDLALDPGDHRTLFAATASGVFKSTDAGVSWSYANAQNIVHLEIDPSDGNVVHAADSFRDLLRTTDGGATWTFARLPGGIKAVSSSIPWTSAALTIDPGDHRTLFASASGRLYRSSDRGASWDVSDAGLSSMYVGSLVGTPGLPGSVLVGSGGVIELDHGILRSDDRGESWQASDNGVTVRNFYAMSLDPSSPDVVYAASSRIFRSADGGLNWTILGSELAQYGVIFSFAVDPSRPATLYAGTLAPMKYQPLSASGIFKSTDGGTTWSRTVVGLPSPQMPSIFSLVVDPSRPGTVYAGTEDGIFASSDESATWSRRGFAGSQVNVLRLAPGSATLFAGLSAGGVYRSDDAGLTWRRSSLGLPEVIVEDLLFEPGEPNNLFVATFGAGVFASQDDGDSWQSFNEGLADLQILRLAFDASGSYLFAGGWNLGVSVRRILPGREAVSIGRRRPGTRVVAPRGNVERATRRP